MNSNRTQVEITNKNIMLQIKLAMLMKGIKQKEVAARMNRTPAYISNLLTSATTNISLKTLFMLAEAAECELVITITKKEETNV